MGDHLFAHAQTPDDLGDVGVHGTQLDRLPAVGRAIGRRRDRREGCLTDPADRLDRNLSDAGAIVDQERDLGAQPGLEASKSPASNVMLAK